MLRDQVYLMDILEAARLAVSYVEGVDADRFFTDTLLQDSVIRRIEIMGEAARRISAQMKAAYPGIPWQEMAGMRNLMIHEYDNVDLGIVWESVRNDIPVLIAQIGPLLDRDAR